MGRNRSRSRSPPPKKDKKSRRRSNSSDDDKKKSSKSKDIKSPSRMETRGMFSGKFTKFLTIF